MQFTPTTRDRIAVIRPGDPAVDWRASAVKRYLETLDEEHLVFRDGATPQRFWFRALDRWEWGWLQGALLATENPHAKGLAAVRVALVEVTGEHPVAEDALDGARVRTEGLRLLPERPEVLADPKACPLDLFSWLGRIMPHHLSLRESEGNS